MIANDRHRSGHRYAGADFTRDFSRHFGGDAPKAPPPPATLWRAVEQVTMDLGPEAPARLAAAFEGGRKAV